MNGSSSRSRSASGSATWGSVSGWMAWPSWTAAATSGPGPAVIEKASDMGGEEGRLGYAARVAWFDCPMLPGRRPRTLASAMIPAAPPVRRAWTYLQERFPPLAHGPVVVAFAGGVACASAGLRGADGPGWPAVVVASVVALGVFFQLRVADEWKDVEEDRLYRPERPVPRGLVTLRELVGAAGAVAVVQVALAAWLDVRLLGVLALVWAFGALMTVEFGAREWLRQRPLATLLTHAPIVPLVDLFSVSCDVLGNDAAFPTGVGWLIGVSLFGGTVIEVGRKVWASADERPGVETYSATWGRRPALLAWAAAVIGSLICGLRVLRHVPEAGGLGVVLAGAAALVVVVGVGALWTDRSGRGRVLETVAGVWTLGLYTVLGPVALWVTS